MSKANLLRHPFGVSMTTFKLPDLASNGGNLLSKFICILRFALAGTIARKCATFQLLLVVMAPPGEGRPVRCHFCVPPHRGADGASRGPFDGLFTSHRFSFSKRDFLGTTNVGFEIAFHQLQGLLVLSRGV